MRKVGLGLMPKLMGQDWTWAFGLLDRRTMVANRTMGLLNCKVMTRDLWATDYGPARQTPPPLFFDLLLCSGKSVVAWKACYGRKWRNGASLQLVDPSLSPGLRLHRTSRFDFGFSTAFQFENRGPIVVFSDKTCSILCSRAPLRRFLPSSMVRNQRPGKRGDIVA